MRHIVNAACGLWVACAAPVLAEQVVVVELYTSQGCSSCPPADEFVAMLASDPRILPLALHVDYWDYIGWADRFAQPKFTDRQRAYAAAIGSRTLYTPQMIIGGLDRIEGFSPDKTAARLREHLALATRVTLTVTRDGDTLAIRAEADPPLTEAVRVQLVRYTPAETITIESGENAGRTITYYNIVTSWEGLGDWSGDAPLKMNADFSGDQPGAVILQTTGPAGIVAAARVD
ncbi:MAG: DUF1223 domain-containing protein [Rhodobacterales bacterium 12-65-15]|nr:MAG: DUF1223 domain-containing protein [Rhodobacterales bacterium 12-65-15]